MTFSITSLLTGVRTPDQGIMTCQQGYSNRIWLSIWSFLLRGNNHNILVDTGLDENELFTPAGFKEENGLEPASIVDCLEKEKLSVDDIDIVINTHLHDDHCSNNSLFKNATFYAHKMEVDFCSSPQPLEHRYDNYFIEELNFSLVESDQAIVPGIRVMHSSYA